MSSPYDTGRFAEVDGLDQVSSHADAARVVSQMLDDLRAHPTKWENPTLERFLDALAASLEALPGLYANRGERYPTQPTWKLLIRSSNGHIRWALLGQPRSGSRARSRCGRRRMPGTLRFAAVRSRS